MSHFFHGWNNGPKCEKLVRDLQGRLKILKDNRSDKAKQLREDILQLLHHGLQQHAFDKAENLFKYEHEVLIYDILDNFCEFMINFSYTNEYKDSLNDMDEAVSSLIFSSSRLRDLPELIQIRKLFRKLYGEEFADVALELLPGNLVNQQIKDCFLIINESVSLKTKLRLMNEIATNCKPRPLLIDLPAAESSTEEEETSEDDLWSLDIKHNDAEARIFHMDFPSESLNCIKQSVDSSHSSCSVPTSIPFSDSVEYFTVKNEERALEFEDQCDFSDYEFINLVPKTSSTPSKDRIVGAEESGFSMVVGCSSESSAAFLDKFIFPDDVKEYESAVRIEENKFDKCPEEYPCYLCKTEEADDLTYQYLKSLSPEEKEEFIQDGLICMKALSMPPERLENMENPGDIYHEEHFREKHLNRESRRRSNNKPISMEKGCMNDSESTIYYGSSSYETSSDGDCVDEEPELKSLERCSEENPCYLCKGEGVDLLIYQSFERLSPEEKEEFIQDGLVCMRALSMSPERLEKDDIMDLFSSIKTSTCHVHPKLPDYDDLSTRFFALKQAYLGCKE